MFDADTERVLEHVRSRKDWMLSGNNIRRPEYRAHELVLLCPLRSMGYAAYELPDDLFRGVIRAADMAPKFDPALRSALLEAAGLREDVRE